MIIDADALTPFVTWGTNPGSGAAVVGVACRIRQLIADDNERSAAERALEYMGLTAGTPLRDIHVDTVFLGSCTNGRIEDLRAAAEILRGRHIDPHLRMLVVPGSMRVKAQAEAEGLDAVFTAAGAEWRSAGCSMCLGMNPDQLAPGERSASTSNRNFEGRQGKGGRTHLVSPLVAAATAVRGTLSSPADLEPVGALASRPTAGPATGAAVTDPARRLRGPTTIELPTTSGHRQDDNDGRLPHPHRSRDPAAPQQRRHRPDHPGGLPQADHPNRLRGRAVRRLALRSELRAEPAGFRGRVGAGGRRRLRYRFVTGACGLGADGLRDQGGHLAADSPTSSAATPARADCSPPR